jgi:ADP-L-glycero-D-manno-heptose 6-epimerase
LFFLDHPHLTGVFNLGSGRAQPFNDVARAVVNQMDYQLLGTAFKEKTLSDLVAEKRIEYIDFPEDLKGKYQSFTQANLDLLRSVGYQENFHTVELGVSKYIQWLFKNANFLSTPTI